MLMALIISWHSSSKRIRAHPWHAWRIAFLFRWLLLFLGLCLLHLLAGFRVPLDFINSFMERLPRMLTLRRSRQADILSTKEAQTISAPVPGAVYKQRAFVCGVKNSFRFDPILHGGQCGWLPLLRGRFQPVHFCWGSRPGISSSCTGEVGTSDFAASSQLVSF